ncbi:MAG: DUF1643 domain-containing protein [Ignavibacteriales bacterium]|nr:MAG: DUF1643 domain-containing protein [Ignavibacteriales bacterium]
MAKGSGKEKKQERKPVYLHPEFVLRPVALKRTETRRYWLRMRFDTGGEKTVVVILKNPSRATGEVSDKTVFNVANYIYKNSRTNPVLKGAGSVVILNLIPAYETYSERLKERNEALADNENLRYIKKFAKEAAVIIAAWGDPPKGLEKEYTALRDDVMEILNGSSREIFYVDKLSKKGNPKHGQIWGYADKMKRMI